MCYCVKVLQVFQCFGALFVSLLAVLVRTHTECAAMLTVVFPPFQCVSCADPVCVCVLNAAAFLSFYFCSGMLLLLPLCYLCVVQFT